MINDTRHDERRRDADRKRRTRTASRLIAIEVSTAALRRRKLYERDLVRWLKYYFHEVFTRNLTHQQIQMAEAILHAAKYGGDQAIAAPRGDGKTTITECVVTYCVLTGLLTFPLILAATGPDAERILGNIKAHLEDNERLHADYNEVCGPIRELDGLPNRANGQLVHGKIGSEQIAETRSRIKWAGRQIVLPTVKAKRSRATGAIIATRGLDAAVRGLRYGAKRPDLAVIDDPETRDLAESPDERQHEKLERKIDQDIAGLAGQGRRLARVMLTTLMRRECVSAKFTDPTQKPSWHGVRFRLVEQWPAHGELWDEYISRRQAGQHAGDKFSRGAHAFYLDHRDQMDDGVLVGNPWRFVPELLPDGSQYQVSTIQAVHDLIADIGRDSFHTEYQNDPPEETGPIESGITAHRVQTQVSGYPRCVIPPGCTVLVQGMDVRKVALHWAVVAFRADATSYVIDYGVQEVRGTVAGSDEGVDVAIVAAIRARMSDCADGLYHAIDGEVMPINLTLVDAGWRTDAVYHACRELGLGIMPAMGFGKSAGCVQIRFSPPVRHQRDKKPGDGWFLSRRERGVWLVCMDADRWKAWEHDRWMTPTDKPGARFMWGEGDDSGRLSFDQKAHHSFSRHIVSEVEVEELVKGALVRKWKPKSGNNHWLDASYMADVAANMKGIALMRQSQQKRLDTWFGPKSPDKAGGAPKKGPVRVGGKVEADGWVSG